MSESDKGELERKVARLKSELEETSNYMMALRVLVIFTMRHQLNRGVIQSEDLDNLLLKIKNSDPERTEIPSSVHDAGLLELIPALEEVLNDIKNNIPPP